MLYFDQVARWSRDKKKALYFHFHKTCCYQTCKGHRFWWKHSISKVTKLDDHNSIPQITWKIKNVISPSPRDVWPPSLIGWWLMIKSCKLQSHMFFRSRSHVTNKQHDIFTSAIPMATKLDRMMAYQKLPAPLIVIWHVTKSCDEQIKG